MSPRLLETAVAAFARWLDTFVAPEDPLPPPCQQLGQPAEQALRLAVASVAACLRWYPHETDLHSVAVRKLMHCLVNRPQRCAQVVQLPEWSELVDAAADTSADAPLAKVHSKLQRRLISAICGAVARSPARPSGPDVDWPASAEMEAAFARSDALLRRLLAPSLALLAHFAQAQGRERPADVASAAGQAAVVCICL